MVAPHGAAQAIGLKVEAVGLALPSVGLALPWAVCHDDFSHSRRQSAAASIEINVRAPTFIRRGVWPCRFSLLEKVFRDPVRFTKLSYCHS
jgi:hypothetical protein